MKDNKSTVTIHADISPDSIASAARAFQIIMVLQEMGEVVSMEPSQAQIETAAPVQRFTAEIIPFNPLDDIRHAILTISEIDRVDIATGKATDQPASATPTAPAATAATESFDIPSGTVMHFEITEEELPIFIAEAEEQLQVLDEGLVELEQHADDEELLQAIFRAAHTLKGAAGMITHKRMVEVTHALETALDGLRKGQVAGDSDLIDLCLEAVDTIRALSGEVGKGVSSGVSIGEVVRRFEHLQGHTAPSAAPVPQAAPQVETAPRPAPVRSTAGEDNGTQQRMLIQADISQKSVASAARAMQIVLTLRAYGDILQMTPDQKHIDRAAPVTQFVIQFVSSTPLAEIQKAIGLIEEIDRLNVTPLAESGAVIDQSNEDEAPRTIQAAAQGIVPMADKTGRSGAKPGEKVGEQTVRTSVERLDNLMNLVGELITDRNRIFQLRTEFENEYRGNERIEHLSTTITHIGRITDQLQGEVMRIRMQPISSVFNKFPRLVRDLSRKANKDITLVMRGEDTELDRSVIENISDPLIHLLRNSVDHGIELAEEREAKGKPRAGTIQLNARHEQGHIVITIEDDGAGINEEKVKGKAVEKGLLTASEAANLSHDEAIDLIFASGLSTARTVTDISGRGVGMDIVRNNIEQLNGSILVETWSGRGTQFQIILPLTLAIVPTLLVQVGAVKFAVPLVTVIQTLRVPVETIVTVNQKPVIKLRGSVLPLTRLSEVFNFPSALHKPEHEYVVVVRWGKAQMGIIVDRLIGEQELVVKSLSSLLGETPGISSAATLGDGQVSLIVDIKGLFSLAGLHHRH